MYRLYLKNNRNLFFSIVKDIDDFGIISIIEKYNWEDHAKKLSYFVIYFFKSINIERSTNLISSLKLEILVNVLSNCDSKFLYEILNNLENDEIINIIEEANTELIKRILNIVDIDDRKQLLNILKFNDDLAGSIMSNDFLALKMNYTIEEAINMVVLHSKYSKRDQFYYVINNNNELLHQISLRRLFFEKNKNIRISEIIEKIPVTFLVWDDQEQVANNFKKFNLVEAPVIDKKNILLGVIYFDEILDVLQEEIEEDFQKMVGIDPFEESYASAKTNKIVGSRIYWLLLLMFSATISQIVIMNFQNIFNHLFVKYTNQLIILFIIDSMIPLISGTSGNAGSQAGTSVIRALATKDISSKSAFFVFKKELIVSCKIGILLCIANFFRMLIFQAIYNKIIGKGFVLFNYDWKICIAITLSLFLTIVISKCLGGILPIFVRKFKKDPSIMASPLLTTMIDAFCNAITYSLCILIFSLTGFN